MKSLCSFYPICSLILGEIVEYGFEHGGFASETADTAHLGHPKRRESTDADSSDSSFSSSFSALSRLILVSVALRLCHVFGRGVLMLSDRSSDHTSKINRGRIGEINRRRADQWTAQT